MMTSRRLIFISATYLEQYFDMVPDEDMNQAIFFFGSDRRWLFPSSEAERKMAQKQPTDYEFFDPKFKEIILMKEQQGLVFWLKPEKDYHKVSQFLANIDDPYTGKMYNPLLLDVKWWDEKYTIFNTFTGVPREEVIRNFKTGEHDYLSTIELLYQSNPTMIPMLRPKTRFL